MQAIPGIQEQKTPCPSRPARRRSLRHRSAFKLLHRIQTGDHQLARRNFPSRQTSQNPAQEATHENREIDFLGRDYFTWAWRMPCALSSLIGSQNPAIEVSPPPKPRLQSRQPASPAKNCVDPKSPICLAFIEIDDMGELFDKGELDTALRIIRQANDLANAEPGQSDPVVITFIHGWKNNASPENGNVKVSRLPARGL